MEYKTVHEEKDGVIFSFGVMISLKEKNQYIVPFLKSVRYIDNA